MARVADEVTRRPSPPDANNQAPALPSAPSEVPLGSATAASTTAPAADLAVVPTTGQAEAILQGSLSTVQATLSGELQVVSSALPSQLFTSPSLPIDACVSDKLSPKIWNNDFFFNSVLS